MESYLKQTFNSFRSYPDFILYRNFPTSLVFSYIADDGQRRVRKLLPEMPGEDREFQIASQWYSYINLDVVVSKHGKITEVDMPWLGRDLYTLGTELRASIQLQNEYLGFQGISGELAENLLSNTYELQKGFYLSSGYVHSEPHSQNVLYHPELSYLPFIDAESYKLGSAGSWENFNRNFSNLTQYIFDHLVIN